jgi:signal transduction histidine kinase
MLADGMVPSEEGRKSYARTLNTESQRLARIVESVLDYARLGRSRGSGGKTEIEAGELWRKVVPPLAVRCDQAGMQLVTEGVDLIGVQVRCDPAQVERILYNLVDNACKYAVTSDDKRIHLSAARIKNELLFTVRDHGPGIRAQEQRRVFKPFMRGQAQSDGSIPGLGLGLSLAQGLARECGGDLKLLDAEGGGAEFRLRMPLVLTT